MLYKNPQRIRSHPRAGARASIISQKGKKKEKLLSSGDRERERENAL